MRSRSIVLSPHLDDAALCLGGLIFDYVRSGTPVEAWTVMAGIPASRKLSPYAQIMHGRWGTQTAAQTVVMRRGEDLRAISILGAAAVHLNFVDALYRRGADGEPLYGDPVQAPVDPHDDDLVAEIHREILGRLRPDDRLYCLLAIGDHVDHVIVRKAAERLRWPLLFAADFPYVVKYPQSTEAKTRGLTPVVAPVSTSGRDAWASAVGAYQSQVRAVFEGQDHIQAIHQYWATCGGVRIWGPSAVSRGQVAGLDSTTQS